MANITASAFISYDENFPLLMPKWGYVASAFILFIIGFFGFFLNLMVILLMIKDRQLWTPLNTILFNLVCSDFFVSIIGNPLTLISALYHQWVFGVTMCMLYGFFMALLGISSITSLTVLSFERYVMVTQPLSTHHRSTTGTCLMIVGIWIYALILTIPPLFGWGSYVNEAANISCSVNWHEQSTNTLTYILFLFAFGQVVPLSIISFSYINILRTIRRNSKRMGQVGRAEHKVTMMVLVMIIAFAVAWTPYSVFALMEQFASNRIISPGLGVIPALVAKSSICYDPLIYIGMNTQFRQSIRKIFGGTSKGNISKTENKMLDNLAPAYETGKKLACRNSTESDASTTVKKEVILIELDKKVSSTDLPNVTIEELDSFFTKNNIIEKRFKARKQNLDNTANNMNGNADAVENVCDIQICEISNEHGSPSPVLTIVDPEDLTSTKLSGAFYNKGFELTVETAAAVSRDKVVEGRRVSTVSGLVHTPRPQLRHSCSLEDHIEADIESTSESRNTKRYTFKRNLTELDNLRALRDKDYENF